MDFNLTKHKDSLSNKPANTAATLAVGAAA